MKQYEVVIWDWNGTLANDVEASLMATNDILKKRGGNPSLWSNIIRILTHLSAAFMINCWI